MYKRIGILVSVICISAIAFTAIAQDGSSATVAYEQLSAELQTINQQARRERNAQRRMELVKQIEDKLLQFRKGHPGTPEAHDAGFQLGIMKHSTQEFAESAGYLSEFVMSNPPRDKAAYAHYYLAEAYKGANKFEDAKREYQLVLSDYAGVNDRLTQAVRANIGNLEIQRQLAIGSEPISFAVKGTNGESLSPSEYKGKVLLLDFWATWCGPCVQEMPNVKRIYNKYKGKGFEIVGISLDRSRSDFDKYVKREGLAWPQYFDGKYWQNDIATQYGVQSIPATYLIDRTGKIRYKSLRGRQLELAVEKLLSENI